MIDVKSNAVQILRTVRTFYFNDICWKSDLLVFVPFRLEY